MKGRKIPLAALALYQSVMRPFLPPSCRFFPSCSDYARQALLEHGAWRGMRLALLRLMRCHPLHPGGFDPVTRNG